MPRIPLHSLPAPLLFAPFVVALGIYSYFFHEPWRDEVQAVLVVRDWHALSWGRLAHEGHPPGFFALLYVLDSLLPQRAILPVAGALGYGVLLWGIGWFGQGVGTLTRRDTLLLTSVLAISYSVGYEMGVIARGYGWGMGLAFAGAGALFGRPSRWGLAVGLFTLAGLFSAPSLLLALGFLGGALVRKGMPGKLLLLLMATAAGTAAAAFYSRARDPFRGLQTVAGLKEAPQDSILPAFNPGEWWGLNLPMESAPLVLTFIVGVGLLGAWHSLTRWQRRCWGPVLTGYLFSSLVFIGGALYLYPPAYRHLAFLSVPAILILSCISLKAAAQHRLNPSTGLCATAAVLCLTLECVAGIRSLQKDMELPFSGTRTVADHLPQHATVVGNLDYLASPLAFHRPDIRLFSPQWAGSRLSAVDWREQRKRRRPARALVRQLCQFRGEVFYYGGLTDRAARRCAHRLVERAKRNPNVLWRTEFQPLWEVNCRCLHPLKRRPALARRPRSTPP